MICDPMLCPCDNFLLFSSFPLEECDFPRIDGTSLRQLLRDCRENSPQNCSSPCSLFRDIACSTWRISGPPSPGLYIGKSPEKSPTIYNAREATRRLAERDSFPPKYRNTSETRRSSTSSFVRACVPMSAFTRLFVR